VSYWTSLEAISAWKQDAAHLMAQQLAAKPGSAYQTASAAWSGIAIFGAVKLPAAKARTLRRTVGNSHGNRL
jgi:hypothetical protein